MVEKNANCSESLNIPVNLEIPTIQESPALSSQNDVIQKSPASYKDFISKKIYNEALFEAQISVAKLMIEKKDLLCQIEKLSEKTRRDEKKKEEIKSKNKVLEDDIIKIRTELKLKKHKILSLERDNQDMVNKIQKEDIIKSKNIVKIKTELDFKNDEIFCLEKAIQDIANEKQKEETKSKDKDLTDDIVKLKTELNVKNNRIWSLEKTIQDMANEKQKEEIESKYKVLKDDFIRIKTELDLKNNNIALLKRAVHDMANEKKKEKRYYQDRLLSKNLNSKINPLCSFKREDLEKDVELENLRKEIDSKISQIQSLEKMLQDQKAELASKNETIKSLKEANDKIQMDLKIKLYQDIDFVNEAITLKEKLKSQKEEKDKIQSDLQDKLHKEIDLKKKAIELNEKSKQLLVTGIFRSNPKITNLSNLLKLDFEEIVERYVTDMQVYQTEIASKNCKIHDLERKIQDYQTSKKNDVEINQICSGVQLRSCTTVSYEVKLTI